MSIALRSCVVLLAVATAGMAADPDPEELFQKVRAKVLDDASHVPRYTCVQTVNRAQFRPQYGVKPAGCRALIAARKQISSAGYLIVRDRLRLDVAVVDGRETFSRARARQFETSHVDDLVKSGATGSGEFISYLTSVFGRDADSISYLGQWLFAFNVPLQRSHYRYSTKGPDRDHRLPRFVSVDKATAELEAPHRQRDQFPPGDEGLQGGKQHGLPPGGNWQWRFVPEAVAMDVPLLARGIESVNEIAYSCHEYVGQAMSGFDDDAVATSAPKREAPQPAARGRRLPPGLLGFRIDLTSPIHSETLQRPETP